ncbi:MAG: LamG-like jellyroll fold domain-containing protein [Nostoc sp.]|uniref:LamG-like jellyroll fold domain-containing protein n=1 Tax=Nostoc sp. TaxID=1180 RepID=UPI002FF9D8EB
MPLTKKKVMSNGGSFEIPTSIKTVAGNDDYFIGITSNGTPYKITKADLLAGLSSGSGGGTDTGGSTSGTDPYFSNVVLLLHGDEENGSSLITNSGKSTYSVSISNPGEAVKNSNIKGKFNNSLFFNGSGSLNCVSSGFNVGSQDCTIEFFLNINSTVLLFDMRPDNTNGAYPSLYLVGNTLTVAFNYVDAAIASTVPLIAGTWYYIALKKIGNITQLWLDGTKLGEFTSGDWASSGRIKLGENAFFAPGTNLTGYIDEFRFTLSTARDLSTVPTHLFPSS